MDQPDHGHLIVRRSRAVAAAAAAITGLAVLTLPAPDAVAARAVPAARPTAVTAATSPNWSGYAALATRAFTDATGSWIQPAAACDGSTHSVAAFWVGLDGYRNNTVEQIGVKATCTTGTATYAAWWQMWPAPVTNLSPTQYPVRPGDRLTAAVSRTGDRYTLAIASSAGWWYHTTQRSDAGATSAEWVASSPRLCHDCRYALLSDFKAVTFSNVLASTGGPLEPLATWGGKSGPIAITMADAAAVVRAVPGGISRDGRSFEDTWAHP